MILELKIRPVGINDLCPISPFPPDDEEYGMYLNALCVDLNGIECFSGLDRIKDDVFRFDANCSLESAKERIKPFLFSLEKYLRCDEIKQVG